MAQNKILSQNMEIDWLVVLGFNANLTAKVISWQLVTHYVFPGFLTPLFFPKPLTTFLKCFCSGERQKYTRKKSRFNRGSNSQPPSHESDTFTTEPPEWGKYGNRVQVFINLRLHRMCCQILTLSLKHHFETMWKKVKLLFEQFHLFPQCKAFFFNMRKGLVHCLQIV